MSSNEKAKTSTDSKSPTSEGPGVQRQEPFSPFLTYRLMLEQWRTLFSGSDDAHQPATVARDVAERFFEAQELVARFLEQSAQAWNMLTPGSDPNDVEAAGRQLFGRAGGIAEVSKSTVELSKRYQELFQRFTSPWLTAMPNAVTEFGGLVGGDDRSVTNLTNLWRDAFHKSLTGPLGSPGFGPSRELEEKGRRMLRAGLELSEAGAEFQALVASTWGHVFEELTKELVRRTQTGQSPRSLRDLVNLSIEVADRVFDEVFHGDTYIQSQGRLLNAALRYRLQERDVADLFLKSSHLASKTELDEAWREIHNLRREMRALKKALAAQPGQAEAKAAEPPAEQKAAQPSQVEASTTRRRERKTAGSTGRPRARARAQASSGPEGNDGGT